MVAANRNLKHTSGKIKSIWPAKHLSYGRVRRTSCHIPACKILSSIFLSPLRTDCLIYTSCRPVDFMLVIIDVKSGRCPGSETQHARTMSARSAGASAGISGRSFRNATFMAIRCMLHSSDQGIFLVRISQTTGAKLYISLFDVLDPSLKICDCD